MAKVEASSVVFSETDDVIDPGAEQVDLDAGMLIDIFGMTEDQARETMAMDLGEFRGCTKHNESLAYPT